MNAIDIRTALRVIADEIERRNYTSAADKVAALVNALPPATDAEVVDLRAEPSATRAEIARLTAESAAALIDLHARRLCESAGGDWSRASGEERDAWAAEVHGVLARLRYDDDADSIAIGEASAPDLRASLARHETAAGPAESVHAALGVSSREAAIAAMANGVPCPTCGATKARATAEPPPRPSTCPKHGDTVKCYCTTGIAHCGVDDCGYTPPFCEACFDHHDAPACLDNTDADPATRGPLPKGG